MSTVIHVTIYPTYGISYSQRVHNQFALYSKNFIQDDEYVPRRTRHYEVYYKFHECILGLWHRVGKMKMLESSSNFLFLLV